MCTFLNKMQFLRRKRIVSHRTLKEMLKERDVVDML